MSDEMTTKTVMIAGAGGDEIEAYRAIPNSDQPHGGVVVIHHMPGLDRSTKEIVRRFAALGFDALCPNLYWRESPGATPDEAMATARAQGGVPDDRLVGDVAGSVAHLQSLSSSNNKVGVIGFCSGGRQSVLAGCRIETSAVIDCYGAFVTGTPPKEFPLRITNLVADLPNLRAPLLGLFGAEDKTPSPEHVAELEVILTANEKSYEFHTYDEAGHAFFDVDRPTFTRSAAIEGWKRISEFYDTHLSG
jgi:carboxymethylenebutenolidase